MRLAPDGGLTVLAEGREDGTLSNPHHLATDGQGNLHLARDRDGAVWRISPGGKTTRVHPHEGSEAQGAVRLGGDPFMIDTAGGIVYVQGKQFQKRRIAPDGGTTTLARSGC